MDYSRKWIGKCRFEMVAILSRPQCVKLKHSRKCYTDQYLHPNYGCKIEWYRMPLVTFFPIPNSDVKISAMASQIISLSIVYSTVYSGTYEIKHQSSASLAFVRGIHRSPVNSPNKEPVTRKMFPFDDVIMFNEADKGNARQLRTCISITSYIVMICSRSRWNKVFVTVVMVVDN